MFIISIEDARFFVTIAESLNPFSYSRLKDRNPVEVLAYVSSAVFVCLLVSTIISLPSMLAINNSMLSDFEQASLSYNIETSTPLVGSFAGLDVLRIGDEEGNFLVAITDDRIVQRNVMCMSFSPACMFFKDSYTEKEELSNLKDARLPFARLILTMLIPGVFLILTAILVTKYLIIAGFVSLLSFIVFRLIGIGQNLYSTFAVCCYSTTVLMACQVLLAGFGIVLGAIEWLIFGLLFLSAAFMSKEKGERHGSGRDTKDKQPGKGASKA